MSRVLRRPMFRGGIADSEGVGITSGLDTPKRGLVDGPGGYAGELEEILKQQQKRYEQQQNYIQPKTSEDILKKYEKDLAAYDLSFMDPDSGGTAGYAETLANTYSAKSSPEYKKKYLELAEAKSKQQRLIGEQLGYKFDPTLYGKNIPVIEDSTKPPPEDTTEKYTSSTLEQDVDLYNKLLVDRAGPDKDEYTRQKYLTLAKFGLNLLKPTPAGVKPNLLSSVATAAEKPLEEYANISMQQSKEDRALKQLATQLAIQQNMPGATAKAIQDLIRSKIAKTPNEAYDLISDKQVNQANRTKAQIEIGKLNGEQLAMQFKKETTKNKIDPDVFSIAGYQIAQHNNNPRGNKINVTDVELLPANPIEGRIYLVPSGSGAGKVGKYKSGQLIYPGEPGF
jgi:hypothetical protein